MAFFPLAAETFGWWHRVGEREVKKLGSDTRDRRRARLSTTSGVVWDILAQLPRRSIEIL